MRFLTRRCRASTHLAFRLPGEPQGDVAASGEGGDGLVAASDRAECPRTRKFEMYLVLVSAGGIVGRALACVPAVIALAGVGMGALYEQDILLPQNGVNV